MNKELSISYTYYSSIEELNDQEQTLYRMAQNARKNAYAPYSDYLVGCSILLENGEIITGSNQENAAYPSGLCAERTAIFWTAANHPNERILKLFVIGGPSRVAENEVLAPPCGACRQSILEYESKQDVPIEIYFASTNGQVCKTKSIRDLLPFSFDRSFL